MSSTPECTVTMIPAKLSPQASAGRRRGPLRVAAYCRVSTDDKEQLTSYQNQITYYSLRGQNNSIRKLNGSEHDIQILVNYFWGRIRFLTHSKLIPQSVSLRNALWLSLICRYFECIYFIGNVAVTVREQPSFVVARIVPLCASTMALAMDKPIP